ncbi:MAG: hypothetical protein ACQET8_22320 [Bacillota bacterium]
MRLKTIIISLLLIIGGLIFYIKRRREYDTALLTKRIDDSLELKKTLAKGLTYRINFPRIKNEDGT